VERSILADGHEQHVGHFSQWFLTFNFCEWQLSDMPSKLASYPKADIISSGIGDSQMKVAEISAINFLLG
jgi:hypothetical protein